jgi:hypothetical protein
MTQKLLTFTLAALTFAANLHASQIEDAARKGDADLVQQNLDVFEEMLNLNRGDDIASYQNYLLLSNTGQSWDNIGRALVVALNHRQRETARILVAFINRYQATRNINVHLGDYLQAGIQRAMRLGYYDLVPEMYQASGISPLHMLFVSFMAITAIQNLALQAMFAHQPIVSKS